MKKLPDECTCNISEEEKIKRFFELAIREFKLCLAILDGYAPKLKFGEHELKPSEIKIMGTKVMLSYDIDPETSKKIDFDENTPIILFDDEGKPLYRRKFGRFWIKVEKGVSIAIHWELGSPDYESTHGIVKRFK